MYLIGRPPVIVVMHFWKYKFKPKKFIKLSFIKYSPFFDFSGLSSVTRALFQVYQALSTYLKKERGYLY